MDKKFELIEIELDGIETLEDTIAPTFGIWCAGCTSGHWGVVCG